MRAYSEGYPQNPSCSCNINIDDNENYKCLYECNQMNENANDPTNNSVRQISDNRQNKQQVWINQAIIIIIIIIVK